MERLTDEKEKGVWRSLDWWTILIYVALLAFGWISICGASYDFDQEGDIFSFEARSGSGSALVYSLPTYSPRRGWPPPDIRTSPAVWWI